MPQPNDLSRSLVALDQDSTIIAVVEMSWGYPPQNGLFQLAAVAVSTPFSAAADCRHSPLCRQTEAASGYSELIRGKGSCHLISPFSGDPLSFVAAGGTGWAMTAMLTAFN